MHFFKAGLYFSSYFDLINTLYNTDFKQMSHMIDLCVKNSQLEYIKEILVHLPISHEEVEYNLLDHNLFLTDNLELFVMSIENKGYNLNKQPEKK